MKILRNIINVFTGRKSNICLVKPGQSFIIEDNRIVEVVGSVTCYNNDPINKKICVYYTWKNYVAAGCNQYQYVVLNYSDYQFKNFDLLNPLISEVNNLDLESMLKDALDREDYEGASEIQKKIDNLK